VAQYGSSAGFCRAPDSSSVARPEEEPDRVNLFVTMFGMGLVTSIHCVFMCGGLVLACAVKDAAGGPWYRRLTPHLVYQGAKIASYAAVALVLGGIVALVGGVTHLTGFRDWLLVAGGVYMVLLGLSMTGSFRPLRYLTPRPPKALMEVLSRFRRKAKSEVETGHASLATPLALGVFTGFLPCTPLIAAQTAAAATGSPITAATAMIGFGLGTAPLMLALGLGSSLLTKAFERKLQIVAAIAVVLFGLVVLNRGLMLVGSPVTFETLRATVAGSAPSTGTASGFKTGTDGVVEVPIVITDTEYHPSRVVIPAGRAVRLVVDRQEDVACSDQLSIPAAHLLVDLKANGVTRVDVPAMEAGTYTLTCGMGMMSGKIVAVRTGSARSAGDIASVIVLVLLALAAVGALGAYLWRVRARGRDRVGR
jgi:sulfite exporter TauE/SafE